MVTKPIVEVKKDEIAEAKKNDNEELERDLSDEFVSMRKLYHKKVKKISGGQIAQCNEI